MRSAIYAFTAIVFYAVENTIIDVRLKQYPTISLVLFWYVVMTPLALGLYLYQKHTGQPVVMPSGGDFWLMVIVAITFFMADVLYVAAYTHNGNAVSITILVVLMPVIVTVIKYVWVREVVTPYHLAAFLFALLAVVCITAGDAIRAEKLATKAKVEALLVRQ